MEYVIRIYLIVIYALDDLQTGSVHNLDDSIGRIEFIKDKVKNIYLL